MWTKAYKVTNKDKEVVRYYLYDKHQTVYVYNSLDEMIDAFSITRYDLELNYQRTGEPYPDGYLMEECADYENENYGKGV